ncbi:hypothetical protein NIES267_74000 (plasmid) [Calothrix parasitica NIES-267]|uniref:Uncharacterized protein n=1 Tax=Calothrix parasitica NIES-267 TaxID=1973488 RepID=A0A1Z4M337_9CYAN|nr:hypothetical protein NIES267_74000 [Calothrix parasitica NIES-267]
MPKHDILAKRKAQQDKLKSEQNRRGEDMKSVVSNPNINKGSNFKKVLFNIQPENDLYVAGLSKKITKRTGVNISKSLFIDYLINKCQKMDDTELIEELEKYAKERILKSMFG